MIETRVDGSPAQVRAGGAWLSALAARVRSSTDGVVAASRRSSDDWTGEASTAHAGVVGAVARAAELQAGRLVRAAAAFAAYADVLEAVDRRAAEVRHRAAAGGLVVDGTLVLRPHDLPWPHAAVDATPAEARQHEEAVDGHRARVDQRRLYDELAEDTAALHADHRRHVDQCLRPLAAELADGPTAAERLRGWWPGAGSFAAWNLATVLAYPGLAVKDRVRWLEGARRSAAERAAALAAGARSGDPSRRLPARDPAVVDERRALARAAAESAEEAERLRGWGRVLGPVGLGVELALDARDLDRGAAPTETLFGTGAGLGAVALVGLALGPGLPAAVVGGGAAVLVEAGSDRLVRALPDEVVDEVDQALVDAWELTTGAASNVGDAVGAAVADGVDVLGGALSGAGQAADDGWDTLRGWLS